MKFAGVDPGRTGAAVLIDDDGRTVLQRERWSRRDPLRITWLAEADVVAVEAQYVGENQRTSLSLAAWSGGFLAINAEIIRGRVLRPEAGTWRGKVLRRSNERREAAKARAMAAAGPYLVSPFTPDEAEAWCMARYAWGWHHYGPEGSAA